MKEKRKKERKKERRVNKVSVRDRRSERLQKQLYEKGSALYSKCV